MKRNDNSKESKVLTVIIIIILSTFIARDFYIKNEVKKSNKTIITKFTLKDKLPKTTSFYFTYFIDSQKNFTSNSGIKYSIFNSKSETNIIDNLEINGFYLAKYNPNHPNTIIVDPTKQITDTVAILQAGFSRDDIKY